MAIYRETFRFMPKRWVKSASPSRKWVVRPRKLISFDRSTLLGNLAHRLRVTLVSSDTMDYARHFIAQFDEMCFPSCLVFAVRRTARVRPMLTSIYVRIRQVNPVLAWKQKEMQKNTCFTAWRNDKSRIHVYLSCARTERFSNLYGYK